MVKSKKTSAYRFIDASMMMALALLLVPFIIGATSFANGDRIMIKFKSEETTESLRWQGNHKTDGLKRTQCVMV